MKIANNNKTSSLQKLREEHAKKQKTHSYKVLKLEDWRLFSIDFQVQTPVTCWYLWSNFDWISSKPLIGYK